MVGQSSSRSKFNRRRLVANSSLLSTELVTLLGTGGGGIDWVSLATEGGRDIAFAFPCSCKGEGGICIGIVAAVFWSNSCSKL